MSKEPTHLTAMDIARANTSVITAVTLRIANLLIVTGVGNRQAIARFLGSDDGMATDEPHDFLAAQMLKQIGEALASEPDDATPEALRAAFQVVDGGGGGGGGVVEDEGPPILGS